MGRTTNETPFLRQSEVLKNTVRRTPVSLELPAAHPRQYDMIHAFEQHNCRFVAGACGTKFGKTFGCSERIILEAWNNKNSLNWWVAPSYAQSKMAFTTIKTLLPKGFYKDYKADLKLVLLEPDGTERSTIEFKSGDNPDTLRGYGVNFAIMDEAARQPYDSYISVWTTLTQTMGRGMFISTPKGRGWFYDVYQKGTEEGRKQFPEWYSIRMPTWLNPHVPLASIEQLRNNMPEDVFRQEVSAEFLLESAGVFRGIKGCIKGTLEDPLPGHSYVMGVDLARLHDFSVITIVDRQRNHVVYFDRFNQIDWAVQQHKIIQAAKKYNAKIYMDSTGLGDPILESVRNSGVSIEGYKISGSAPKQQLIDKLRVNIENQRISFPVIPIVIGELERYEYDISESGTVRYNAPTGFYDDCVISLALANFGADSAPFIYRFRNVRGI